MSDRPTKGDRLGFVYSLLVILNSVTALAATLQATQGSALKTFALIKDPNFRMVRRVVGEFAHKHRSRQENTFCAVGFFTNDNIRNAWVIWKEGGEIFLWDGGQTDLDTSRRIIHLNSDVVPLESDLHGSTYLVTKAWVRDINSTCKQSGIIVKVPAHASSHN